MKNKWTVAAAVVITLAVIVVVALMMKGDRKPAQYTIENGSLTIDCSFGITVPVDKMDNLSITDTAPDIRTKTNGSGVGSVYKGEFELADGSAARLYIDESVPPFIRFTQGETVFYISAGSAEETQALYDELLAARG